MHTGWSPSNFNVDSAFDATGPGWYFVDIIGALERDELWTSEAWLGAAHDVWDDDGNLSKTKLQFEIRITKYQILQIIVKFKYYKTY